MFARLLSILPRALVPFLMTTKGAVVSRPSMRSGPLQHVALALVVLLSPGFLWANNPGVTFAGVVSVLSTGSTSLSGPVGVVVDSSWNVYIADTGNNQIVKIASNGTVSVLAVTGLTSPSTLSSPKEWLSMERGTCSLPTREIRGLLKSARREVVRCCPPDPFL